MSTTNALTGKTAIVTGGAAGIGAVLVEKDAKGLSFGRPELLMGFRGIPSSDIFLDVTAVDWP